MDKRKREGWKEEKKRKERVLGKKIGQVTQCFEHSAVLWKSKEKSASKLSRDSILRQFWEQCQNEAKEIYLRPSHKRTSVLHDWELHHTYYIYTLTTLLYRHRMLQHFHSAMCWNRTRTVRRALVVPQPLLGPTPIKDLYSGGIHIWILYIYLRNSSRYNWPQNNVHSRRYLSGRISSKSSLSIPQSLLEKHHYEIAWQMKIQPFLCIL